MAKTLQPAIRFSGFTDDWEQRKLGELFSESDKRSSEMEILSVSVSNGIYPASESDRDTNPGASLKNYKVVCEGDIVYNSMRMWQGAVDSSLYRGIVSPAYVVARPSSEVSSRFFARLLKQPQMLCQYQKLSQGNSKDTQTIRFDRFAEIQVSMPSCLEQNTIGVLFDSIDNLITLHQRKCEQLKNVKKSMLEKMFPKEGETVPEIRFSGFTAPWEQRKVTELLKNTSDAIKIGPFGSALKKSFFTDKGIKVYAQENAFSGDFSIGNYYISEAKYNELKSCELKPGDLVISMMGTVGACAIFPENAEKGIMNSHLLRLQFSEEVLPEYIMFLLRDSQIIRDQIDRLSVGSIMTGLSSTVVKKLVFPVPKRPEQQKIVELLKQLDNLITLHQRKLELLQNVKRSMLEKMFV